MPRCVATGLLPLRANVESVRTDRVVLVAPAGTVGDRDVWWVDPDGWSVKAPSQFTYLGNVAASPTISSVVPTVGPTGGNTRVTLGGTNFQANSRVRFGADDAITETQTPTQLVVKTPSPASARVPVPTAMPSTSTVTISPVMSTVPSTSTDKVDYQRLKEIGAPSAD